MRKELENYLVKTAAEEANVADLIGEFVSAARKAQAEAPQVTTGMRLQRLAGNAVTFGPGAANTYLKARNRRTSEALAERLLEGFGKNRKKHEYFKVGRGTSKWMGRLGGLAGATGGAVVGGLGGGGKGALLGGGAGGLGGYVGGRLTGAGLGFLGPVAAIDTARNALHVQRVKRLAKTLRRAGAAGGLAALGLGGLAAYKKSQK